MFRDGYRLSKAKHPKKGKPEIYRISKTYWRSAQLVSYAHQDLLEQRAGTYWSSAQLVSYAHQDLLEQRASRSGTYWSSAQVKTYIQQDLLEQRAGPIGAARRSVRNLLEQRADEFKPIGAARKSFSQAFDFS
jgi:hypothetical protein